MPHLVILRQNSLEDIVELSHGGLTLGVGASADRALKGPGLRYGNVVIAQVGHCYEVRADDAVPLRVNGRAAHRRLLRSGDRVEIAPYVLYFWTGGRAPPRAGLAAQKRITDVLLLLASHCHASLDSTTLLERILDGLLALSEADRGFILLSEAGTLVPIVSRRIDPARAERHSRTVVERVLTTGQGMIIQDTGLDPELAASASVKDVGIRSVLAVPIREGSTVRGVIYLDSAASRKVFGVEDLSELEGASEHVAAALRNARERDALAARAARFEEIVADEQRDHDLSHIVARSPAMRHVLREVRQVAAQLTSTLVLGESGTGKELIARAIHDLSPRRAAPFVAVNCMALSPSLLESELFGHEKGAFTGANERRLGRFEQASGGTIFLDEIGELEPSVQVKLLRVLQESTFERVGSGLPQRIDVRLICATNVDMKKSVATGRFREDLYYRIAVFPIHLPALRDRAEDIPVLVEHFIRHFTTHMAKPISGITPAALDQLRRYRWPGNIRELRNVTERAFVLENTGRITVDSLPLDIRSPSAGTGTAPIDLPPGSTLADAREVFERRFILDCLERHQNNIAQAARELDVPRSTIYRKLESWGLGDRKGNPDS